MALPFVLGLVAGAATVAAFNNKKEIKEAALKSFEKGKEVAEDIKDTAKSTVDCVKEKISKEEEKPALKKRTTRKTTTRKTTAKKPAAKKTTTKETDANAN